MSQVTIETLGHFSTYGNGPKGDYICTVQGDDRELLLFHDTSSKYEPPKVGDSFDGEIKPGKRNGTWRLSRVSSGGGGFSSTGGGGGSTGQKTYERQPDHPLNMARAVHNGALSSVTDVIEQRLTLNIEPAPTNDAEYWAMYGRVYKKLRDSYPEGVLAQAGFVNGAVGAAVSAPQEVPADTSDFTPAPAGVGDDVPF